MSFLSIRPLNSTRRALACAAALCLLGSGAGAGLELSSLPGEGAGPGPGRPATATSGTKPALSEEPSPVPDGPSEADLAALRQAVAERPGDGEAHYRLALALRQMRRRPESLPHFEKAVAIGPATRGRLLDLGVAYSDVSRFEEAEAAYTRLLALSPGDPDAYLNLANNAVRRGQFDRGIELFGRAIAVSPDFLFAHYHLGHTLKFLGRRAPAEAEYQKVLGLPAKTPREAMARVDALYQIGSMDLAGGDAARAEGRFAEVIRVAPDHIAAHWGRAQALLRLGRNEEARAEIETHSRLLARRMPSGPAASAH